jgi:hypothetical protein
MHPPDPLPVRPDDRRPVGGTVQAQQFVWIGSVEVPDPGLDPHGDLRSRASGRSSAIGFST